MRLSPGEYFTIARQLNDPADVATYYVRAFIRNARTDALLETLNLTNQTDQRFIKEWQVPADPSGLGFYITITTKVYTDSGYTTLSTTYGVEQHEHLIQDRTNPYLFSGPGGADVDYKRLQKMIEEAVAKSQPKEADLLPISEGLQALLTEIRAIKIPEPKETSLEPVLSALGKLQGAVEAIRVPETDMSPVSSGIEMLDSKLSVIESNLDETLAAIKTVSKIKDPELTPSVAALKRAIDEVSGKIMEHLELMPLDQAKVLKNKARKSRSILNQYLND